jgi:hypothetical protein
LAPGAAFAPRAASEKRWPADFSIFLLPPLYDLNVHQRSPGNTLLPKSLRRPARRNSKALPWFRRGASKKSRCSTLSFWKVLPPYSPAMAAAGSPAVLGSSDPQLSYGDGLGGVNSKASRAARYSIPFRPATSVADQKFPGIDGSGAACPIGHDGALAPHKRFHSAPRLSS